ncbi:Grx4 family monothiol glutaredoxin [Endozoicomonas sp.]|uniref:Grx4 family monothiol glutaredoxin n=1 Tax=Endozoicomonas sp. TaxID=1892382 RepID=UPI0028854F31|nr:Grx4 family monothiol glutaredoxin [Endozoicomonas sp.]
MDVMEQIKDQIESHTILLYMKGSPKLPQCGFSSKATQILMACGEQFAFVDVLANPEIRANLPKYANWPTFPQLWIKGELIGGSDIIIDMYNSGELQKLISEAAGSSEKTDG